MLGNVLLSYHSRHHGRSGRNEGVSATFPPFGGKKAPPPRPGPSASKRMASLGSLPQPGGFSDRVEELVKKTK